LICSAQRSIAQTCSNLVMSEHDFCFLVAYPTIIIKKSEKLQIPLSDFFH
jgi:hypothetical protein